MKRTLRACERFVRCAHRRAVLFSILEGAGIGVAAASALGAVLVIILLVEGKNARGLVEAALALGAAVGLVWGLLKRPKEMEVAAQADSQLRLHELLGTALSVLRRGADDEWSGSVVAMADEACARLSPGMLVMNRLGSRAWGGIGVATALLLTLGVMSWLPGNSQVQSRAAGAETCVALAGESTTEARGNRQQDEEQSNQQSGQSWEQARAASDDSDRTSAHGESDINGDARAGEGSTCGRTQDSSIDALRAGAGPSEPVEGGPAARTGAGRTGDKPAASGADSDGIMGISGADRPDHTPIWEGPEWSRRRNQAAAALKSGRTPGRYGPVIRQYFDQIVD